MRHFCTYFDRNYLVRGLTLYRSLERHAGPFELYVLCLDAETYETLMDLGLSNLRPVGLEELEAETPALLSVKPTRSRVEYFFTCSPAWPLFILDRFPGVDLITYLDADLFFYSSPSPIYAELGNDSVLIVGHRFPAHLRQLEVHGVYNVGLLSFRNDAAGRACLERWRDQCLEWCYDRVEDGRFADQKYLDEWPDKLEGVRVLQHAGAGLAPWNWMNHRVAIEGDNVLVDGEPLVFYHFHAVKQLNGCLFDLGVLPYGRMPGKLRRWFYGGYVRELRAMERWVRQRTNDRRYESPNARQVASDFKLSLHKVLRGDVLISVGPVAL